MREWVAFWNARNSIYVSDRHRDVHYRTLADDIARYVTPGARVLDYGCGEALHADRIARAASELVLADAAPAVREALASRFAETANIAVRSPAEVEALPDGAFDLIVMVSVAQYLPPDELDVLLRQFARLLRPGGKLVLGDVVPASLSPLTDAWALLAFAARNGFLLAAVAGLARTAFSDYRRLRAKLGITVYEPSTILGKLAEAGFTAHREPQNVGHNPARMTFVAVRGA
jgi:SAM-dependent methyltransferase